jgi:hypothetical protein
VKRREFIAALGGAAAVAIGHAQAALITPCQTRGADTMLTFFGAAVSRFRRPC